MISEKEGTSVGCEWADTEREEFPRDGFHLHQLVETVLLRNAYEKLKELADLLKK